MWSFWASHLVVSGAQHHRQLHTDAYDFTGKTVVPFFTSGGSQLGEGQNRIGEACKGARF